MPRILPMARPHPLLPRSPRKRTAKSKAPQDLSDDDDDFPLAEIIAATEAADAKEDAEAADTKDDPKEQEEEQEEHKVGRLLVLTCLNLLEH